MQKSKYITIKDVGRTLSPIGNTFKSPILKPWKADIEIIRKLLFQCGVTQMNEHFADDRNYTVKLTKTNYTKDFIELWKLENPGLVFPYDEINEDIENNKQGLNPDSAFKTEIDVNADKEHDDSTENNDVVPDVEKDSVDSANTGKEQDEVNIDLETEEEVNIDLETEEEVNTQIEVDESDINNDSDDVNKSNVDENEKKVETSNTTSSSRHGRSIPSFNSSSKNNKQR